MELFGLTLAQLLAVFGGAATLAVLLHLLRAHRRRVAVPFLPLWDGVLAQRDASQLLSRMPRWLALVLTLLMLALLTAALGDPRLATHASVVTHKVVLIDTGLASQAMLDGAPRARAIQRWAKRIADRAGPLSPTMLVSLDASPAPLGPFSTDGSVLSQLTDELRPSDLLTDVERGHRFALEALEAHTPAEIIFVGTGRVALSAELSAQLARMGIKASQVSVGSSADNLAITTFAARRYPLDRNRSELLIGLQNQGARSAKLEVTILGDDQPIDVRAFELAAGASEQRAYDDLAFSGTRLEARLRALAPEQDVLPADSRAYAVLPPRKKLRVLCVTEGNRYLEAALLLDEYFTVDVAKPAAQPPLDGYDVAIFDRVAPASTPTIPALYLAPPAFAELEVDGEVARPRFDTIRRDHPIVRHVALGDVNIAAAQRLRTRPGDAVIASSAGDPLLIAGQRKGEPFVALAFDIARSDLPLRVAWPLLLINTLDWFANEQKELAPVHVVGELAQVAVAASGSRVAIAAPDGTTLSVPVVDGRAAFSPDRAGFFRVRTGDRAWSAEQVVAVSLDAARAPQLAAGTTTFDVASLDRPRLPELWTILIAGALALLVFEWLAFHRRWAP